MVSSCVRVSSVVTSEKGNEHSLIIFDKRVPFRDLYFGYCNYQVGKKVFME